MTDLASGLSPWRALLSARLAAERTHLLLQLEGLDETTLTSYPLGPWPAAVLLAHLAYWDAFYADRLSKLIDGRRNELQPIDSVDSTNAAVVERLAQARFDEALATCLKERRNFLAVLGRAPDELLRQRTRLGPGWRVTPLMWVRWRYRHDAAHGAELARRRRELPPNHPSLRAIHRALLRPILGLARREFLALAALVPPRERESRSVVGVWTLKQVIGHISDYERLGVIALRAVAAGREPDYPGMIPTGDAYNAERDPVWAALSWDEAWAHFDATRRALLLAAESLAEPALAHPFTAPWLMTTTPCGYLLDMAQHEREHADDLRRALGLAALPRRLGRGG
jgi:hypothetical protein